MDSYWSTEVEERRHNFSFFILIYYLISLVTFSSDMDWRYEYVHFRVTTVCKHQNRRVMVIWASTVSVRRDAAAWWLLMFCSAEPLCKGAGHNSHNPVNRVSQNKTARPVIMEQLKLTPVEQKSILIFLFTYQQLLVQWCSLLFGQLLMSLGPKYSSIIMFSTEDWDCKLVFWMQLLVRLCNMLEEIRRLEEGRRCNYSPASFPCLSSLGSCECRNRKASSCLWYELGF